MERRFRFNLLLDFYGALLGDRSKEMLRLYLEEDMSLQEIAESFGVSRQAVHDSINRSEKQLEEYEEKLGLIRRFDAMKADVERCREELGNARRALDRAQEIISGLE